MVYQVRGNHHWELYLVLAIASSSSQYTIQRFSLKQSTTQVVKPSSEARKELLTMFSIAPLIQADISRGIADIVICPDASLQDAGVIYSQHNAQESS